MTALLDIPFTVAGEQKTLRDYPATAYLLVNTASRCGFTPQYAGLQELYTTYAEQGLVVLTFPCNQFGQQEPGTREDIAAFCEKRFHVTFPIADKIDVKGAQAHPLFVQLTQQARGLLGSRAIKWNFTKFLLNGQGQPMKRFGPLVKPEQLSADIQQILR